LIDTAGIRSTDCEIEQLGVNKSLELRDKTFFKILVINPLLCNMNHDIYKNEYDQIVITHADFKHAIKQFFNMNKIFSISNCLFLSNKNVFGPIGPDILGPIGPDTLGPIGPKIRSTIEDLVNKKYLRHFSSNSIIIERQRNSIKSAYEKLNDYERLDMSDLAILLSEIFLIHKELSELMGMFNTDQLLNNIFDNFCIGK